MAVDWLSVVDDNGGGADERHVCAGCAERMANLERQVIADRGHAAAAIDLLAVISGGHSE